MRQLLADERAEWSKRVRPILHAIADEMLGSAALVARQALEALRAGGCLRRSEAIDNPVEPLVLLYCWPIA